MPLLITPAELAALLDDRRDVRLLDVRWRLDQPEGRPAYLDGHLPGAVYVDLDGELAQRGGDPRDGRHPLPSRDRLQAAARRWGLNDGETVVVYDDVHSVAAARAWWILSRSGVADVRVLDGGLRAWTAAGHALALDATDPEPGDITLSYGTLPVVDADAAAGLPGDGGLLLDARAGERFRGEVEPVDPRAGHIPGAVSAPTTESLDGDGLLLSPARLVDRFAALGVRPGVEVAVYCGSGVTAAHTVLAMEAAGLPTPALYPGSFSAWSNDPDRPVATGG